MRNEFYINLEAAIYREGKWLLGVRSSKENEGAGVLAFPGGTLEHSDSAINTIEACISRETKEEVGVHVRVLGYAHSSHFISKKGNHVLDIVLVCEIVDGEPTVQSVDEFEELLWLSYDEILTHVKTPPWLLESLKSAQEFVTQKPK